MRQPSKTDLTDAPWTIIKPLIPPAKPGGRPRAVEMREVLNTLLYRARAGRPWEMLPHDLLPKSTVYDSFAPRRDDGTWQRINDALRQERREAAGREPTPRVGDIDRRTIKATEVGGVRGSDGGKLIRGRERHLLFDSLGLRRAVLVPAASADDGTTAPEVLGQLDRPHYPRLGVIYGDNKYKDRHPEAWLERTRAPFRVEAVKRPEGQQGSVQLPERWVAERSFARLGRGRRHSKDYGWYPESSEAWIKISAIGGMLRKLAPDETREPVPFMYRKPQEIRLTGWPLTAIGTGLSTEAVSAARGHPAWAATLEDGEKMA